jgi:hypothetical protein
MVLRSTLNDNSVDGMGLSTTNAFVLRVAIPRMRIGFSRRAERSWPRHRIFHFWCQANRFIYIGLLVGRVAQTVLIFCSMLSRYAGGTYESQVGTRRHLDFVHTESFRFTHCNTPAAPWWIIVIQCTCFSQLVRVHIDPSERCFDITPRKL